MLMWVNLSSHLTKRVREAVASAGHTCISRPTHSPDFDPVENCFGEIDGKLRGMEGSLTLDSFPSSLGEAAAAISVSNIRGYFAHFHYFVPELAYKVYNGEQ